MVDFHHEYIAVGGNRHPSAADWDPLSGLLAFGADSNVAIWLPSVLQTLFLVT
jgi:elongator complex protein 2